VHADGSTIDCEFDHGEYISTPSSSSSSSLAAATPKDNRMAPVTAMADNIDDDCIISHEAHPQVDDDSPVATDNASTNALLLLQDNHRHHQQQQYHHHQQQQQSPPAVVPLSSREIVSPLKKQSRRVKKAREVETAGYSPVNPSYLLSGEIVSNNNGSSSVEDVVDPAVSIGHSRRVILKPHHYS